MCLLPALREESSRGLSIASPMGFALHCAQLQALSCRLVSAQSPCLRAAHSGRRTPAARDHLLLCPSVARTHDHLNSGCIWASSPTSPPECWPGSPCSRVRYELQIGTLCEPERAASLGQRLGLGLHKHNARHQAHQDAGQVLHIPGHIEGHQADHGHRDLVQAADQAVGGGSRGAQEPQ